MARNTFRTWVDGELVDADLLNEQIKENLTEIWQGTTAGDMDYYVDSLNKERIPIGANSKTLQVVAGVPTWVDAVPGIFTTKGDLPVASGADAVARLGVGANYSILQANSGATNGLEWSSTPLGAKITLSTHQAILNNTESEIASYDTVVFDYGGFHTGEVNLICRVTGIYDIGCGGYWDVHSTVGKLRQVGIRVNGANLHINSCTNDTTNNIWQEARTVHYLTGGDEIKMIVKQTSGVSLNFNNASLYMVRIR
jgi:hypothetical protein